MRYTDLFSAELCNSFKQFSRVVGVCDKLDGRKKVKREYTHNGLCVNGVSALDKVYFIVGKYNAVNELTYILNVGKRNHHFIHFVFSFRFIKFCLNTY